MTATLRVDKLSRIDRQTYHARLNPSTFHLRSLSLASALYTTYTGCADKKNNPLGKIRYLRSYNKFCL